MENTIKIGDLNLDHSTGKLYHNTTFIKKLANIPNRLLYFLSKNQNRLTYSKDIQKEIWSYDDVFIKRTLDVHIRNLRIVLKSIDSEVNIETIHTLGFVLNTKK